MTQQTERKVRDNLTGEEKERLQKFGSIEFKSSQVRFSHNVHTEIFIPSREQH